MVYWYHKHSFSIIWNAFNCKKQNQKTVALETEVYFSHQQEIWRCRVVSAGSVTYQGLRVHLYFYSIIFSALTFVFMLVASKMATAVTDLTSLSKAGRREIREKDKIRLFSLLGSTSFSGSLHQTSTPISLPGTPVATWSPVEDWGLQVSKEEGAWEWILGLPANSIYNRYFFEHLNF